MSTGKIYIRVGFSFLSQKHIANVKIMIPRAAVSKTFYKCLGVETTRCFLLENHSFLSGNCSLVSVTERQFKYCLKIYHLYLGDRSKLKGFLVAMVTL